MVKRGELSSLAHPNATHGMSRLPEYEAWFNMRARCQKPHHHAYAQYGGRGIQVCERWRDSFENFIADLGLRPSKHHTLERQDNDGNYEPGNCRWATRVEQGRNKTNTYTEDDDAKIREAIARGYTFKQMAAFVGKPRSGVMSRAYRLGLRSGCAPSNPKRLQEWLAGVPPRGTLQSLKTTDAG